MTFYERVFRKRKSPEKWEEINTEWSKKLKNSQYIQFPKFIDTIKTAFLSDVDQFLSAAKRAHKLPQEVPEDFPLKTPLQQTCIFFSFFQTIFSFEELDKFVEGPNIGIDSFKRNFSEPQFILFDSISIIFRELLNSVEERHFTKYAPVICSTLAKLIIPKKARFFQDVDFELDIVYISPCIYTGGIYTNVHAFVKHTKNGETVVVNAHDNTTFVTIQPKEFSIIRNKEQIELYSDSFEPQYIFQMPSVDAASILSSLLLTTPPVGFNHIIVFLKSLPAFKNVKTFFHTDSPLLPNELSENLNKILNSPGRALLLYAFMLPPEESKINDKNALLCLQLMGNKILPFFRAGIELNWMELMTGGLVLRQNTALTYTSTAYLKATSKDYLDYIIGKFNEIINNNISKFSSPKFNAEEALIFCKDVFQPCVDTLIDSVDKMPSSMRYILRTYFIRTAGHYINNRASLVILPNFFLLRFVIPELTIKAGANVKFASTLGSSLLMLFYLSGWAPDKDPELSKLNKQFMEPNYSKILPFTLKIIDCEDCDLSKADFTYQGPMAIEDFIEHAALRLPMMNLTTPNKVIHSHMDMVSVMQMIEEFTFNFKKAKGI